MIVYAFTKYADRQLVKLPKETQRRIVAKLRFYLEQNDPFSFAKFIRRQGNASVYRFRIGDFRVIGDWDGKIFLATQIRPRKFKGIYK